MGDAINWEWVVECAKTLNASIVIVSRDRDYGATYNDVSYVNDHLRQEFSNRISQTRELLLYSRISDALKHFPVAVTAAQVRAEEDLIEQRAMADRMLAELMNQPLPPQEDIEQHFPTTTPEDDFGQLA